MRNLMMMGFVLGLAVGIATVAGAQTSTAPAYGPPSSSAGAQTGGSPECPQGTTVTPGGQAKTAAPETSSGTMSGSSTTSPSTSENPSGHVGTGSPPPSGSTASSGPGRGSSAYGSTSSPSVGSSTQAQPKC